MQLTPAERAQAVVKYLAKKLGVTQYQIGERIGYTNRSALSAVLTGAKTLPQNFGGKLAALDPEINPAFLSGESDEMLRDGPQPFVMESPSRNAEGAAGIFLPVEVVQMFTDLSAAVRSQQDTIRMLLELKDTQQPNAH